MNDLLSILIDSGYFQQQFDAHPRDMWAYTVLVFALGVAIGCAASRWLSKRELKEQRGRYAELEARLAAERERFEADGDERRTYYESEMEKRNKETKRLQNLLDAEKTLSSSYKERLARAEERLSHYEDGAAEEAEAARKRAEAARRLVLGLEPWLKRYLRALQERGGTMETQSIKDCELAEGLYPIRELLERTRVSGVGAEHVWRVSLNEYGSHVVKECADLIDEAVAHEEDEE